MDGLGVCVVAPMRAMPNMPMETSAPIGEGGVGRTFNCYTAPGVVFYSEEEMKAHYRSEWHRYNLKRKVAGLPPLAREAFEERAALEAERSAVAAPTGTRSQQRRQKRDERAVQKAAAKANNPHSKAAHYEATKKMDEEQYVQHKMETAVPFDECCDLFSSHRSASMQANLEYMAKKHGFYVPYLDYCTDVPGLLAYLLEKVRAAPITRRPPTTGLIHHRYPHPPPASTIRRRHPHASRCPSATLHPASSYRSMWATSPCARISSSTRWRRRRRTCGTRASAASSWR